MGSVMRLSHTASKKKRLKWDLCMCGGLKWLPYHSETYAMLTGECIDAARMLAGRGRLCSLAAVSGLSQAPDSHGRQEQEAQARPAQCVEGHPGRCSVPLPGSILVRRETPLLAQRVDVQASHLVCEEAYVYLRNAEKPCSPYRRGSRSCKPWRHQHRSWARLSPRQLCRKACQTPQHHPWQGIQALVRATIPLFGSPPRVSPMSAFPCIAGVRQRGEECLSTIRHFVLRMLHEVTMSRMQLPC